jgi:hypothetical protein
VRPGTTGSVCVVVSAASPIGLARDSEAPSFGTVPSISARRGDACTPDVVVAHRERVRAFTPRAVDVAGLSKQLLVG